MRGKKTKKIERQLPSGNQSGWSAAGCDGHGDAKIFLNHIIHRNFNMLCF